MSPADSRPPGPSVVIPRLGCRSDVPSPAPALPPAGGRARGIARPGRVTIVYELEALGACCVYRGWRWRGCGAAPRRGDVDHRRRVGGGRAGRRRGDRARTRPRPDYARESRVSRAARTRGRLRAGGTSIYAAEGALTRSRPLPLRLRRTLSPLRDAGCSVNRRCRRCCLFASLPPSALLPSSRGVQNPRRTSNANRPQGLGPEKRAVERDASRPAGISEAPR